MKMTKALATQILEDDYGIVADDLPTNGLNDLISLLIIVLKSPKKYKGI